MRGFNKLFPVLGLLLSSCGIPERGYPLYPEPATPLLREEIVVITGDIAKVDEVPVPVEERTFEVLPGCHSVSTPQNFARGDGNGAMMADLPEFSVAVMMQAGHSYVVNLEFRQRGSSTGYVTMMVYEYFPSGKRNDEFNTSARCVPDAWAPD
jgi:hypothetical protein